MKKIQRIKFLEREYEKLDSFHRAISPILSISKYFALMPLVDAAQKNPYKVKFRFESIGTITTFVFLFCGIFCTMLFAKKLFLIGITPKSIVGLIFFSCGLTGCSLFISLAQKWPKIITFWTNVELIFLKEPYKQLKPSLLKRIRISALIITLLSAIEHGLYFSSNIYNYTMKCNLCNGTESASYGNFMTKSFQHIFDVIPFSTPLSIVILIINVIFTIIWNYMDFFIMMISMGISIRFEQINNRLHYLIGKSLPEYLWIEIRQHYVSLCELLEYVDDELSNIILLSCMNNLYFICFQLLNIFNKLQWPINYIYFWYSLLYLIGRTIFIFLCAAAVNDEAKHPLKALRRVPSDGWNIEVERFIFEITNNCIALSGKKFYYLTRKLLFGMAGTIITYELVLLQFDEQTRAQGPPAICD